jgi:hypothetical protein
MTKIFEMGMVFDGWVDESDVGWRLLIDEAWFGKQLLVQLLIW